jgi:hypothetical protein
MAVDGLRLLSEVDIVTAAGGFQPNLPGEGGGGPSAAEVAIEGMFSNWGSQLIGGDEYSSFMADGGHFYDSDQNGYYDYVEMSTDGGVWVYDFETDEWEWRGFEDNEAG